MQPIVSARQLAVAYPDRTIFDHISIDVLPGETVAVMGRSGSGKTTLLHCLAGLRMPTSGEVILRNEAYSSLSESARARRRLLEIGLVFQFGELMPELNVTENVALPARLAGVSRQAAVGRASELLGELGIDHLQDSMPASLSGGEVQRAAIARALVNQPALILADEPTGALDDANGELVAGLLLAAARARSAAVIIATHDARLASAADRMLVFKGNRLTEGPARSQELVGTN